PPAVPPSCFSSSPSTCALSAFPTRRSSDLPSLVKSLCEMFPCLMLLQYLSLEFISASQSTPGEVYSMLLTSQASACCSACKPVKDRKSTRLNSSHVSISYAVFCLKKTNSII